MKRISVWMNQAESNIPPKYKKMSFYCTMDCSSVCFALLLRGGRDVDLFAFCCDTHGYVWLIRNWTKSLKCDEIKLRNIRRLFL